MFRRTRFLNELYNYEKKWEPDILKLYRDKKDFHNSYLNIIRKNPQSIYEYIINLYRETLANNTYDEKIIKQRLHDTTSLLFAAYKIIKYYDI